MKTQQIFEQEVIKRDDSKAAEIAKQFVSAAQKKLYEGGKKPTVLEIRRLADKLADAFASQIKQQIDDAIDDLNTPTLRRKR